MPWQHLRSFLGEETACSLSKESALGSSRFPLWGQPCPVVLGGTSPEGRVHIPAHRDIPNELRLPKAPSTNTNASTAFRQTYRADVKQRACSNTTPGFPHTACTVDSNGDSVHTTPTPSLRSHTPVPGKTDVDSHFRLEEHTGAPREDEPSSAGAESPPPFSSHNFPSRYFPAPSPADPYRALVTECATESLTAYAPCGPAPPFEEAFSASAASSVVADTKAALPRDTKGDGQGSKDLDDGEPPPPYTEGSSPLEGFTYVMAAAGSIITQVQQGGPAPINTALGGMIKFRTPMWDVH